MPSATQPVRPEQQQQQQQRRQPRALLGSSCLLAIALKTSLLGVALSWTSAACIAEAVAASHRSPRPTTSIPIALSIAEAPASLGQRLRDLSADVRNGSLGLLALGRRGGGAGEMPSAGDRGVASQPTVGSSKGNGGRNSFLAGGLAGSISTTITCPIEVVKTQLQASSVRRGSNAFSVASAILKNEGPAGFFRGLAPGLVGIIPARSTYFLAYSKSKEFWTDKARLGDRHRDLTEILCGLTAGIVQNTITNPIWMVKTRMQLLADTASGQVAYGGYREAIRAIWQSEGPKGFYKGMSASYWGCSEGCLYFVIYERLKRHLRKRQNEDRARNGLPPADALPPAYLFVSSAFSKMCATITTYPHEVMRTRLREQARNGVYKYTGMWQSLFLVAREEGRRGLYAGMGTHVARVVPNMAIMMLSYELISDWLRRRDEATTRSGHILTGRTRTA